MIADRRDFLKLTVSIAPALLIEPEGVLRHVVDSWRLGSTSYRRVERVPLLYPHYLDNFGIASAKVEAEIVALSLVTRHSAQEFIRFREANDRFRLALECAVV